MGNISQNTLQFQDLYGTDCAENNRGVFSVINNNVT